MRVALDSENQIAESDHQDNKAMLPLEIGGTLIREWERIHVDYGREHLAPGTNIIIGKMDDALARIFHQNEART